MRFNFKKPIFIYAFILYHILPKILSLKLNKYIFIPNYRSAYYKSKLNSAPLLMPEPSLQPELSPALKPKVSSSVKHQNEKLRQTMKSIKEEYDKQLQTSTKEERKAEVDSWKVILYNDDIHSFTYVTESLSKCVPQLPLAKAHLITLEAHKTGQALVLVTWKNKAEQYCRELQKFGLTVCTVNEVKNPR